MAEPSVPAASRRVLLACAGAACAAVLAGCSRYNSNNGGVAGSQPQQATSSPTGMSEVLASAAARS